MPLTYHHHADALLAALAEALEPAFESGALEDVELSGGVLTILTAAGKTFVVSKHNATQQVWFASPISGGLHFVFNPAREEFTLADGRDVASVVLAEVI